MVGLLGHLAGGAAQGLGKGIVAQAQAKRQRQREAVRRQFQMQQDERDFEQRRDLTRMESDLRTERAEQDWQRKRGQVVDTFAGESGTVMGVTRGGETKPLGRAATDPVPTERIVSGDTEEGKRLGLKPGERTTVTYTNGAPTKVGDPYTGAGAGDDKSYEFDRRYQLALDVYGGDKKKALDFARGTRRMTDAEARKFGYEVASDELQNADLDEVERVGGASAWVDQRASEVARRIRAGKAQPSTGGQGSPSASSTSGITYEQALQRAEREAESRDAASMWSDGDFGDMTREEWVTRRTRELMGEGRSQQPGQAARNPDILTPRSQRGSGNSAPAGDTGSDRPKAETRDDGGKTNTPTLPRDRSQWQKGKIYSHPTEGRVRYLGDDQFERVR